MSKLRRNNDSELLTPEYIYIYCVKRNCKPRINILVCDQCAINKKCAEYQCFFRESLRPKKRKRRATKRKK